MYLPARPACHEVPQAAILIVLMLMEIGLGDVFHLIEKYLASVQRDATLHRITNGARLLINLFEHEMLEAALPAMIGSQVIRWIARLDRIPLKVGHADCVAGQNRDLAVAQEEDITRVLQNRRNI